MSDAAQRLSDALADRYRLERELGQGGMATVYLAEDVKHRRQVAIKVLNPELANALGPERFLREIEIAARLHHPHILPLHDSGEAGGFLYYVMPLAEGESLRDRLDREKQLPMDDALQIAREVGTEPRLGERRLLFHLRDELYMTATEYYTPFDVAPDGRFIMARSVTPASALQLPLVVVDNWFEELRQKVGR